MTGDPDRVVGFMCSRSRRPGNRCEPITEADRLAAVDLAWLTMTTRATAPEQTPLAQYPCPGGCGGWVPTPSPCIDCWAATRTYSPREVAMLDKDDPRRRRVRASPPR